MVYMLWKGRKYGKYEHGKHIRYKQLNLADIYAYRQQHSEPLVTDFFRWV